jgi:hypothetical protein
MTNCYSPSAFPKREPHHPVFVHLPKRNKTLSPSSFLTNTPKPTNSIRPRRPRSVSAAPHFTLSPYHQPRHPCTSHRHNRPRIKAQTPTTQPCKNATLATHLVHILLVSSRCIMLMCGLMQWRVNIRCHVGERMSRRAGVVSVYKSWDDRHEDRGACDV